MVVGKFCQLGLIVRMGRTQHQTLRYQDGAVDYGTFAFELFLFGDHVIPPDKEKGEMATHLPLFLFRTVRSPVPEMGRRCCGADPAYSAASLIGFTDT